MLSFRGLIKHVLHSLHTAQCTDIKASSTHQIRYKKHYSCLVQHKLSCTMLYLSLAMSGLLSEVLVLAAAWRSQLH